MTYYPKFVSDYVHILFHDLTIIKFVIFLEYKEYMYQTILMIRRQHTILTIFIKNYNLNFKVGATFSVRILDSDANILQYFARNLDFEIFDKRFKPIMNSFISNFFHFL